MAKPEVVSQLPLVDLSVLDGILYKDIGQILYGHLSIEAMQGGSRSIGFKITLSNEDPLYFLKVYYKTPIPRSDLSALISESRNHHQFSFDQLRPLHEEVAEAELFHMALMRQVEQQAAAHVVGNKIRPNLVVPLHAIWVYQEIPVGYTTEFIEGKPITTARALELGGVALQKGLEELQENGVTIDCSPNHYNAIKTPSKKIKLIDLDYEFKKL